MKFHGLALAPLAILNLFFGGYRRLVVTGKIHRHHIAVGRLAHQALLRRDAHRRLGAGVVDPQVAAVAQHHLARISNRLHETQDAGELATGFQRACVADQRRAVDLNALFEFRQRDGHPKRLVGVADGIAGGQQLLRIGCCGGQSAQGSEPRAQQGAQQPPAVRESCAEQ